MGYMLSSIIFIMLALMIVIFSVSGVYFIINLFMNLDLGVGATLLSISYCFISLGLIYPCFILLKIYDKYFKIIINYLNGKVKELVKKVKKNEN
jgi:hypothetical protein